MREARNWISHNLALEMKYFFFICGKNQRKEDCQGGAFLHLSFVSH